MGNRVRGGKSWMRKICSVGKKDSFEHIWKCEAIKHRIKNQEPKECKKKVKYTNGL